MIQSNIATGLVAIAIVVGAPIMNGADRKPVDRIPKLVVEPKSVEGELILKAGDNDKTLLLQAAPSPHAVPFNSKGAKKVEGKTLFLKPKEAESFYYTIDSLDVEVPSGPWLGVHVSEVPALAASHLNLTPGMGLAVEHVVPGSPADKAGLKKHDILVKLGDQSLINPKQLVVLVRSKEAGEKVTVEYLRGGETHFTKAKITDRNINSVGEVEYLIDIEDKDVVLNLGTTDPVVVDRRIVERMHPIEKGVLASAMSKGTVSKLKKGMHTSVVMVENNNLVLSDESGTYNLRTVDGKKRLVVLDPEGETIYKGDLTSEKSVDELPEHIRVKVREMTSPIKKDPLAHYYKKEKTRSETTEPAERHVEEHIIIKKNDTHE